MTLSCQLDWTDKNHSKEGTEIAFDQQSQKVRVGGHEVPAVISDSRITFQVDLGTGAPLGFAIDRMSGLITIVGMYEPIANGQCIVADPGHRAF